MADPTAALTFADLITEVAYHLGIADYGVDGSPTIPTDTHDLVVCKRQVNNGIRMFISDAPNQGWRWASPVAAMSIWANVEVGTVTVTGGAYVSASNETPITASASTFFPSMEAKTMTITDVGDVVISRYVSSTLMYVYGDYHTVAAKTFSIKCNASYTLPQTFGGQYTGPITFAANTNRGISPTWVEEALLRERLQNTDVDFGIPFEFSVRLLTDPNGVAALQTAKLRTRWELACWNTPDQTYGVSFPYSLYFDNLTVLTQTHPAPFAFDEAVKAACLAVAERDVEKIQDGPMQVYYREVSLANAQKIDNLSAPKTIGTTEPGRFNKNWRDWRQLPTVRVN